MIGDTDVVSSRWQDENSVLSSQCLVQYWSRRSSLGERVEDYAVSRAVSLFWSPCKWHASRVCKAVLPPFRPIQYMLVFTSKSQKVATRRIIQRVQVRGAMAGAVPFADDPLEITPIQDFEVAPLSVKGAAVLPSHPLQKRAQNVSSQEKSRWSSQRTHRTFEINRGKHPLSTAASSPLLRDLSVSEFSEMAAAGQERIFSRGQTLHGEGDPLRWVSIITSGHVKAIRHSASGKLLILHVYGPGDVLDGLGCAPGSTHSVEARAVRHCRVVSWDVGRFDSLVTRFPALARNSIRLLLERIRMLEGRVHELAMDRVPQRLAKILLRLILQRQSSARGPWIDLTGEDLAQMAGTTQFTVSRLLCDWAAQRIIQPERSAILVENLPGLIAIATRIE